MRDYYRDMDLATNATFDEIKGQYRRLAKQFHPDRNNSTYAQERFREISDANCLKEWCIFHWAQELLDNGELVTPDFIKNEYDGY